MDKAFKKYLDKRITLDNAKKNISAISDNDDLNVEVEKIKRFKAEGNLNSIKSTMEAIKTLIDVVMPLENISFVIADTSKPIELPTITYEVVSRENSEKTPLGPKKINTIKEYVDGKPTGDNFEIYTTFFDCLVEFNFYGNNKTHSVIIQEKFEDMIEEYKGYLKNLGLSNMYFQKEISSEESLRNKKYVGSTLVYYIEIQRIKSVRTTSLKSVSICIQDRIKEDNPNLKILDELSLNNNLL